jgi:RNA polymerase-binding transcription factor DksA
VSISTNDFEYNNEEESEMAQLHSIHLHMNAVAAVQKKLAKQRQQESLSECEECGDDIPKARQLAVPGVRLCICCKERSEKQI